MAADEHRFTRMGTSEGKEPTLRCAEITPTLLGKSFGGRFDLHEFFQFERYERNFTDMDLLGDCHVVQLFPIQRVDWGGQPGPPDPGIFHDLFPEIVSSLVPPDSELYLHVKGIEPKFLDEFPFVTQTVRSLGTKYMLLSPVASKPRESDLANLIFECPLHFLPFFCESAHHPILVEIEGYVMQKGEFGRLADCYFRPDSVETVRRVLSVLQLGFRIWSDFNGMIIFSEQYSAEDLARMIPECTFEPRS
jgi:hypothetical protein